MISQLNCKSFWTISKNILNSYDYEPLPSNPKQKRWENTAQWAKNTMVNEGLLAKDSPWGIWEITDKGKNFYEEKKSLSKGGS